MPHEFPPPSPPQSGPPTAGHEPITGVLLAAGRASRFGADKLLHPLADGTPIGLAAARALKAGCPRMLAVLRPDQGALAELFEAEGIATSHVGADGTGMGGSLAHAVSHACDASAWVVALADMPWLTAGTVREVVDALAAGASLVAPVVDGRRGHPVGFAADWRDALLALRGDRGARELLARESGRLTLIDCRDRGAIRDVDTPADLAATR